MTWPPQLPAADITNTTEQTDRHPADHNTIATALADIVGRVNAHAVRPNPAHGPTVLQSGRPTVNSGTTITFPEPFAVPPFLVITLEATDVFRWHFTTLTATSFRPHFFNSVGAEMTTFARNVHFIAFGRT